MAKGTDSEEFVVLSSVRAGLKREFAFAFKSRSEIGESLGRTRSRNAQARSVASSGNAAAKRSERCLKRGGNAAAAAAAAAEEEEVVAASAASEEEAKSDVVDGSGGDEGSGWAIKSGVGESAGNGELGSGHLVDSIKDDDSGDAEKPANEQLVELYAQKPLGDEFLCKDIIEEEVILPSLYAFMDKDMPLAVEIEKTDSEKSSVDEGAHKGKPAEEQEQVERNGTEKFLVNETMRKIDSAGVNCLLADDLVSRDQLSEEHADKVDDPAKPSMNETVASPNCSIGMIRFEKPLIQYTRTQLRKKTVEKDFLTMQPLVDKIGFRMPLVEEPLEENAEKIDPAKPPVDEVVTVQIGKLAKRFTRSALKPKHGMVKKSAGKDTFETNISADSPIIPVITPPPNAQKKTFRSAKKFPAKLKELLDTGLLEGQPVRYMKGPKARGPSESGLRGVIKGSGIVCHCSSCKGTEVVTPIVFELHAGSSNKRPPEYIYLDSGSTLRDVINAFQQSTLSSLEETVRRVIGGSVIGKCAICFNCKGSISEPGTGKSTVLCNSCDDLTESTPNWVEIADYKNSDVSPKPVFTSKLSNSALKSNSSQSKSQGRITRKDIRLHKLVFAEDILPDGTEVAYYARGQKLLVGYKMGSGIICSCCNSEVSPSQFEAHAGWASRRKPYLHIYTSNGVSLHELALSLSRDRKFSTYNHDDLCFVCRDGGDLLSCDGCPRAFHERCLNLPTSSTPSANWYCKFCQNLFDKEKNVEHNADAVAAGRVSGVDPIEQITNRCIRIMNTEEIDFGGCALCRGHDFSKSGFGPSTVLFCDQCEKEFHVGCLKDHGMQDLKELPDGMWFCCKNCQEINQSLQKSVVHGEQELLESLLNLIKKKHNEEDFDMGIELDIKWRIVNRKIASNNETESLLSQAVSIFHDCFAPITDSATRRDLIPEMLFGNSIMGQDFSRMYCAMLTVNQCVVSAGVFRIYGSEVAELPLVATCAEYQRQGYFQVLFSCFERYLSFLNVRNLMLPAAEEAESIWTNKFGFSKLAKEELNKYKRHYQMMIFQGTSVLRKTIPSAESLGAEMVEASGCFSDSISRSRVGP